MQERIAHEVEAGDGERHGTAAHQLVEEGARVGDTAGVDEAGSHVQAVGELVALDPQC